MTIRNKEVSPHPHRRAMADGSRAFQRPVGRHQRFPRRGATVEMYGWPNTTPHDFKRRAATRGSYCRSYRGMNPTATIIRSLRDEVAVPDSHRKAMADSHPHRGAMADGSRAFQRPVGRPLRYFRRGATVETDDWSKTFPHI